MTNISLFSLCALAVAGGRSLETVWHAPGLSRLPMLAAQSLPPGSEAPPRLPPLVLPDLAGQAQALRAAPDEITVLNFWAPGVSRASRNCPS